MSIGVVGEKCRMTRIFDENGASIPVTPILLVTANRITQVKTPENDGYSAIQLAYGEVKPSRVNKPRAGHFAKAAVLPGKGLKEFRVSPEECAAMPVGTELNVDLFKVGQVVDVTGFTKGRGFTGVITRWNFRSQRASHGNSLSHNAPGSIGQNQSPGRVFKGKKMCGHYGNERQTIQNLEIIRVDTKRNMLLIKGAVPGAKGGMLIVRPSVKGEDA